MARLPFNPDMFSSPPPLPPQRGQPVRSRDDDKPMTVTQLAGLVKETLSQGLPAKLRIVGQISNLSSRTHWFFNLKDSGASIRCVCFASAARKVSFPVKDGIEIIATGRIDFYDAQGNVQLYVDKIEPVGIGELELKYRALCEELRTLGYFDIDRKKPLPLMPQGIAVVTSKTGAALQDVINTAHKRWPGCRLMLFDVRVQGAAAAPEIAKALNLISKHGRALKIEAVLLTRGGGSMEDLWAFNERIVADAVFKCTLPIVAAIGHETDTTIAELVADLRCATPTQAAMTMVPDQRALNHQVAQLSHRLRLTTQRHVQHAATRLTAIARHTFFRKPDQMYGPIRERLNMLASRLGAALPRVMRVNHDALNALSAKLLADLPRQMKAKRERLESLVRQLESISPQRVLERGYSYTLTGDGGVLKSADDAKAGDTLTTVLSDGRVSSRVIGEGDAEPAAPVTPSKKPRTKKQVASDDQPGLF